MIVGLIRHGDATRGLPDEDRELSPLGRQELQTTSKILALSALESPIIIHSPLKRALQSAEIIKQRVYPSSTLTTVAFIKPEDKTAEIVTWLGLQKKDSIIVSHMPFLGALLAALTDETEYGFETGELVLLKRVSAAPDLQYKRIGV